MVRVPLGSSTWPQVASQVWSSRIQGAGGARFREVLCQSKNTFGVEEIASESAAFSAFSASKQAFWGRSEPDSHWNRGYLLGFSKHTLPALGLAFLEEL